MPPSDEGGGENLRFSPEGENTTPQSDCLKSAIRQLTAVSPVAALTVHRTVIHYRDCASLTPDKGS